MSFVRAVFVGLAAGLVLAFFGGYAMLSTNNNGEFANQLNGEWTGHFYTSLALLFSLGAVPLTLALTVIGILRSRSD
ncbi:MAG: hypothetical protein AAGK17_02485 [Pseudomonadota bacterium]